MLFSASDTQWRDLVDAADIISEGAPRADGGQVTWYGSTSLVLPLPEVSEAEKARLVALAAYDPHLRIRAIRLAHREASARAASPLGRAVCELRTESDPKGLRIDVEVEAPLIVVHVPGAATAAARQTPSS